uniref:SAM domain-containing protein n=1 Tax=Davidia involucrata TaxID=16924 RepID=A0A5B6YM19_DAVIN
MSKPQVTITLGRTGQKVIKRPRTISDGTRTDSQPLLGSKRSVRERFGSNAANSSLSMNKRRRGDVFMRSAGYNRVDDARVGQSDLRLKLMRKKQSRQIRNEVEEWKKMDLREKMSKTIRSPEQSLLRRNPPTRSAGELLRVDPLRKSYSSYYVDGLRPRSPDRVPKTSRGISPPRNIDELWRIPSTRPIDASRTGRMLSNDVLDPSRPLGHAPITARAALDAGKSVTGLPLATGSMPKSSYIVHISPSDIVIFLALAHNNGLFLVKLRNLLFMGEQPLTVGNLLHSLGLGKYAILFQAEEVDMAALKQMGDKDLKELGIPMGPRKKILLAILPRSKQQPM